MAFSRVQRCKDDPRMEADVSEKAVGKAKEAWGALTGDEAKKEEGRALQRKAEAEAEAAQRERTRQAEAEAKKAERQRDEQARKDKGALGGLTDTLPKL